MKNETIDFKRNYINWIKEKIDQYQIDDHTYRMTMPFLDRNNDRIEFYVLQESANKFKITDDGSTLNELDLSGVDIFGSPRRKAIFTTFTNAYGVHYSAKSSELFVESDLSDLPFKKHMLAQCMAKVSDLFYLSRANVKSLFLEDVKGFLLANDVSYTPNVSFVGKSKLVTHYDFLIGRTKRQPSRAIEVINHLDLNKARITAFNWDDTKEAREKEDEMHLFTFIDDTSKEPPAAAMTMLYEYGIQPILWHEKEKYIDELAS